MLDPDVKVLKQVQDARFEDGKTIPFIRVSFKVGDHGPFVQKFDLDGFTGQKRDDALNVFAREVRTS